MKFAVSNLALPALDHSHLLPYLRPMGIAGIEIAPAHTWSDLSPHNVVTYRDAVQSSGLEIVGLHDLLAARPDLGIFTDQETTLRTVDYLEQLSAICRDLGGHTLVFGSAGRHRGDLTLEHAWTICEAFFELLLPKIEDHGTVLCLEPSGISDSDFCLTARECRLLAEHLDHASFGYQLNSKAQVENDDTGHASFAALRGRLNHFHANEPGLVPFGTSGRVNHPDCRRHLAAISYKGWVTMAQRVGNDPLANVAQGFLSLSEIYTRQDNLALDQLRPQESDGGGRLQAVRDTLESVRPALINDGGDIELVEVAGDIIRVRLTGACTTCSLASQTIGGIRRKLVDALGTAVRVVPVS